MIVDAHIHYAGDHPDALAQLAAMDLKLLNVAVAHGSRELWRSDRETFRELANHHRERYGWCTTFDPPHADGAPEPWDAAVYADEVVAGLARDFEAGAVACKIWKNVGMQIRKPTGDFLMVDDPALGPVYEYLASVAKPLLMHIGEPLGCWQPLDDRNPHAAYYRGQPQWYMGDKPNYPSHGDLIDARDRVLARHPRLRVVGAHLASLEYDVSEVADRLARYSNFAIDTSARLRDLAQQDSGMVREFFVRYQDRILYGTDVVQRVPVSAMPEAERRSWLASLARRYASELAYYRSGAVLDLYGRKVQGINLPGDVLDKVLCENALRWYPGL